MTKIIDKIIEDKQYPGNCWINAWICDRIIDKITDISYTMG